MGFVIPLIVVFIVAFFILWQIRFSFVPPAYKAWVLPPPWLVPMPQINRSTPVVTPEQRRTVGDPEAVPIRRKALPLRILQWNIERGIEFDGLVDEIVRLNPDILVLQELDIGCDRTNQRDIPAELAEELCERFEGPEAIEYIYAAEFLELRSPIRIPLERGGAGQGGGSHGNAIFVRASSGLRLEWHAEWPLEAQGYNWGERGHILNEPRMGNRIGLLATVTCPPEWSDKGVSRLLISNNHLETFTSPSRRMAQFGESVNCAMAAARRFQDVAIVASGDMNTLVFPGIAKCSTTAMDLLNILYPTQPECVQFAQFVRAMRPGKRNPWPWMFGLGNVLNKIQSKGGIHLEDPLESAPTHVWGKDKTMKLDWIFVSKPTDKYLGLETVHAEAGPYRDIPSDHAYLLVDVQPIPKPATN
eukprot:NODE_194_length_1936_cov_103.590934_g170_i0.p1 GENE.NODE_194_length_1936_cov_103.590934_g170_i0~~NODE_194_length_1936_cov_103.590934_g170_i0.p1  ORF type:complete len:417 (-),score=46.91 NODE_194_length_1936_cov_103.590934_g170_i0:615-1865(-)